MKQLYLSLMLLTVVLMTKTASAATLIIDGNGILTGAQNVSVLSNFYDVVFRDNGDFYNIFGSPPAYDADDYYLALAFSEALMEQVFLDGAQGAFDSNPSLIAGCESTTTNACIAVTPFRLNENAQEINSTTLFFASQAINYNSTGVGTDNFRNTTMLNNVSFTRYSGGVFADWSPSAVPLPAAVWLFGSGLLGLIGVARRKKA